MDRGNVQAGLAHHRRAAEHLGRSVELNPHHYLSFHNYAWSLYRLGRVEEAVDQFRRAIACSDFGYSRLYLAVALVDLGRDNESEREFREATRLLPKDASVPFERGEALLRRGRGEEARAWYAEALRLNPSHRGARQALDRASTVTSLPPEELIAPAK
jgi:tetratricopeptide (TPR) repeat protein